MNYMTEEFLSAGLSVIYDTNAMRSAQRKALREMAAKHRAHYILIWLQIDHLSALTRSQKRDKRTNDEHYAQVHSQASFDNYIAHMQNPNDEPYLVISGKHTYNTQKNAIYNKLYQMGLIKAETIQSSVARPDLVNLIPTPPPFIPDDPRRNISIS